MTFNTIEHPSDRVVFAVYTKLISHDGSPLSRVPISGIVTLLYTPSSEENGTGQYAVQMTQKPRYGDFGELNPVVFPGEACPGTPPRLGNRSVFILDPRLPVTDKELDRKTKQTKKKGDEVHRGRKNIKNSKLR